MVDFRHPNTWLQVNDAQDNGLSDHAVQLLEERDRSVEDAIGSLQGGGQGSAQASGGDTFSAGGVSSFTVDPLAGWTGEPPGGFWLLLKVLDTVGVGVVSFYTNYADPPPFSLYVDNSVSVDASLLVYLPGTLWSSDWLTCEVTSDGACTNTGSSAGVLVYW